MTIIAAADGSALGNPGPAGWAWYVNDECWAAGGWKHATNNQGELKAVLELFRATAHLDEDLHILCDSQYVINSVTKWMPGWKKKGWKKGDGKPVLNLDLLKEIDEAITGRRYRFEWVKGHVGHVLNEAADIRARSVAEAFQRGSAIPSGPGWTGDAGRVTAIAGQPGTDAAEPTSQTASAVRFSVGPDADALTPDGADDAAAAPGDAAADAAGAVGAVGAVGVGASATGVAGSASAAGAGGSADPADPRLAANDVKPITASVTPSVDSAESDGRSAAQLGVADDDDALFSFDDLTEWRSLSLNVTTEEWTRLSRRARERGVSIEEFLRSLI